MDNTDRAGEAERMEASETLAEVLELASLPPKGLEEASVYPSLSPSSSSTRCLRRICSKGNELFIETTRLCILGT
jgi:hypothetical protein